MVNNNPARHIVLLGASNLTINLPRVIANLRGGWEQELHVLAAHGHGRSYGNWSRVLARSLPGIVECDLWSDLENSHTADTPVAALITDVGNDLIYGSTPEQIAGWVEQCVNRLTARRSEIVLTLLPMESVRRLSAWRYHTTRMIFFPGGGPVWSDMQKRAVELNERLRAIGEAAGARLIEPPGEWYGFDPIHVRYTSRAKAWRHILSHWTGFSTNGPAARVGLRERFRLQAGRPAERRLFGKSQRHAQPSQRIQGMAVSVY